LESVLTQQPAPYDVVVSDDGSSDDLESALRPFRTRITLISGPNRGLAVARNRAAAVAQGDLLALLDADDVWLPGRMAAFACAAAARPDLAILTTDAVIVRNGKADVDTYYAVRQFYIDDQPLGILRNSFIFGAGAVRAHAFHSVAGYRPGARYAEDWDLWLRLIFAGHRAGLIDQPLYEYRRSASSLTGHKVELCIGVLAVLDRARALVTAGPQASQLQQTEQRWREAAAQSARRTGDGRARALAVRAATGKGATARARLRYSAMALAPRPRMPAAGVR
jgi:glycosyltransferase involved in cell wall biosynthesis